MADKENEILKFMENIIYLRTNKDKEGLLTLMEEGEQQKVTLDQVGDALIQIIDDVAGYTTAAVNASQQLQEARLKAIIEALPTDTKEVIERKFKRAEDDLLTRREN
jgi:hypothetical protein